MVPSNPSFVNQLNEVIIHYPNLKIIKGEDGNTFLKGVLDIPDDNGEIVGSFLTEIHSSAKFPYRFPILFETGGDILNVADWHKYRNGACCITVEADEILKCRLGINVLGFINKYAIGFFANHIHRKITGTYKNGEYAHGKGGLIQFYSQLFFTEDMTLWIEYVKYAFEIQKIKQGRNDQCFCGSARKYKNCHSKIFDTLRLIGKEQILNDFKKITTT